MARSLWKNQKKWSDLQGKLQRSATQFARTDIRSPLVSAVAYMNTEIPFDLVFDFNGNDLIVGVQVSPSANFIRESDGQTIPAHFLFHWLDKGTDVKHIKFIHLGEGQDPNYGSSTPYGEEIRLLASTKYNLPGIEARNWTETIAANARAKFPDHIRQTLKSFLGG